MTLCSFSVARGFELKSKFFCYTMPQNHQIAILSTKLSQLSVEVTGASVFVSCSDSVSGVLKLKGGLHGLHQDEVYSDVRVTTAIRLSNGSDACFQVVDARNPLCIPLSRLPGSSAINSKNPTLKGFWCSKPRRLPVPKAQRRPWIPTAMRPARR